MNQVVELKNKADVVAPVGGQLAGVAFADLLAVHQDGALVAGIHAAQNIQHRGFARARGTHDDDKLPFFNVKGDVIHRRDGDLTHFIPLDHVLQ